VSVRILDTTLREGEQTPGVYFDVHVKTAVAGLLDEIGVDVIEAGHPAVTDDIRAAVSRIARSGLRARVGAHARSLESDVRLALDCGVSFLGIFYCVSDERLADRGSPLASVVAQIVRAVRLAKEARPDILVRYTPEDTVRSPFDNVVAAASEAVAAGADVISVADTTGCLIPGTRRNMYDYVGRLRDALAARGAYPLIAVHCHNDRGLALANALDGYRAGADIIDASVMALGERAGLVDLASLLTVLAHDMGEGAGWRLEGLPALYRLVSRFANVPIPPTFPIMGRNAFTHCAGVHTQAALRNPLHYQSLDPAIVGRRSEIALDHMSGMASLRHSLEGIGEEGLPDATARAVLARVKAIGQSGRTVDREELALVVEFVRQEERDGRQAVA
jgi:2-isopropylmalate synthase